MYKFGDNFGFFRRRSETVSDQSLHLERSGKEIIERLGVVVVILMDVLQEVVGPLAEVRSCRLAASHHGVDDCSILGGVVVLAEQVVLPAYGYRTDAVLDEVVVRQLSLPEVVNEK